MRGLKSTLALLVVLVGLGAYIYFVDPQPDSGTPTKEKAFASLKAAEIEELRIKSESGDVTTVKKDGTAWQVLSPIAAKAAETEVSSVTSAIEQIEIDRVIDENAVEPQGVRPRARADRGGVQGRGGKAGRDAVRRREDADGRARVRQAQRRKESVPRRRVSGAASQQVDVRSQGQGARRLRARQDRRPGARRSRSIPCSSRRAPASGP